MATAQVLKATHTVDDRVVRVDDKVAHVDERVAGVEGRVASVHDKVKAIDNKVAVGIDGAQPSLMVNQETMFNPDVFRGKRDKGTHTTSGRQHGSGQTFVIFFYVDIGVEVQASSQGTNYARTFSNGSLCQIRLLTTTLPVVPITRKQRSGFSMGVSSPNGSPMARFCGFTGNVRSSDLPSATVADDHLL